MISRTALTRPLLVQMAVHAGAMLVAAILLKLGRERCIVRTHLFCDLMPVAFLTF